MVNALRKDRILQGLLFWLVDRSFLNFLFFFLHIGWFINGSLYYVFFQSVGVLTCAMCAFCELHAILPAIRLLAVSIMNWTFWAFFGVCWKDFWRKGGQKRKWEWECVVKILGICFKSVFGILERTSGMWFCTLFGITIQVIKWILL